MQLGVNEGGNVRRGKFIQAAAGTRTNTAYGALSNGPDQVSNIVLPTDGLIVVAFQALWQQSVSNGAFASIFIGANQLKNANSAGGVPVVQEATMGATNATDSALSACPGGLTGANQAISSHVTEVTTGQSLGFNALTTSGGPCYIFAAAGTYTIAVMYKASSGTVTVKNRKLWCWVNSFG